MRRWSAFVLVGMFLTVVTLQGYGQDYLEGKAYGELAAGSTELWIGAGAGCLFGPLGYLYLLMISKEPGYYEMEQMKGKSEEYKGGFRRGYADKKKSNAIMGVTGGCLVGSVLGLMLTVAGAGAE